MGELFEFSKKLGIVNFIFVDSVDNIKKFEYETWYKNCVDNSTGIWVGNGINDQYTIKTSMRIDDMKRDVPEGFCFVINKGRVKFVKYVSKFNLKNDTGNENLIDDLEDIEMLEDV